MFNRREQQALLGLAAALLVGSLLAVGDWFHPAALSDFRVIPRAVEPPPPLSLAPNTQGPVLLNSATAVELAFGVAVMTIPSCDAASISMLSRPTPARATISSCGAADNRSDVTQV